MILSFKDTPTRQLYETETSRKFGNISRISLRKLIQLHAAVSLDDLKVPPGNKLEALRGARKGQHSVRINDQYRICFRWTGSDAEQVEICDYH